MRRGGASGPVSSSGSISSGAKKNAQEERPYGSDARTLPYCAGERGVTLLPDPGRSFLHRAETHISNTGIEQAPAAAQVLVQDAGLSRVSPGVVVVTHNRRERLLTTLTKLQDSCVPIVVVDNASTDGTAAAVRRWFPEIGVIELDNNAGAAARTVGVRSLTTEFVAFSDDDSWWAPGALERAGMLLSSHPEIALIAARILVGRTQHVDRTCELMAASPLGVRDGLPGPSVLGFVACGSVVRRSAFLEAGGFLDRFGIGGEEELLAIDLASRGWALTYVPEVVAHHHPSREDPRPARDHLKTRNGIWTAWLRRPARSALSRTLALLRTGSNRRVSAAAYIAALRGIPWVLKRRQVIAPALEHKLQTLTR